MKRVRASDESGYTIVELMIAIILLGIIVYSTFQLFTALVNSSLLMKRKAVALSLATNQMEYLKSLPYNSLAVAGGSIVSSNPLPATVTKTLAGTKYTVTTSINYVDDAYDGCGSYPSPTLKQTYCRSYPPPTGAPATDTNAADYKIAHVKVTDTTGIVLSDVDSEIAARVAETASNTGALFVKIIDANGNPLSGATAHVTNTTSSPTVDVNDVTDQNGVAIFYGLPPDTTNYDYYITGSLANYSTLATIPPSGSLQPYYSNVQILTQQSSTVTLQLMPMGTYSLAMETVDTAGTALGNVKVYVKGGYKKYNSSSNTAYYYDNVSPSDTRPITDAGGLAALTNLVPGDYYICGDAGATSCSVSGTTYYLAAAIPYTGDNAFSPIGVPTYQVASPPAVTFSYNGNEYLQKVRLILTPYSTMPRVTTISPSQASIATSTMSAFTFQITGTNMPCTSSGVSCGTTVTLQQGSTNFPVSCKGAPAGTSLSCTADLTGAVAGATQMTITANSRTLSLPAMTYGGINVVP